LKLVTKVSRGLYARAEVINRQQHTFQELLARVFLEEGLVDDGSSEIVNHELHDWVNVRLGVTSVVRQSLILAGC